MKYVVIRDTAFITNPFLLLRSNGYIPSRSWFMKRLHQVFGNERSGHSLRSGGATAYAQGGVRSEVIQRMGRWKSDTFETYIHGHPLLNLLAAQQEVPKIGGIASGSKTSSNCHNGKLILIQSKGYVPANIVAVKLTTSGTFKFKQIVPILVEGMPRPD